MLHKKHFEAFANMLQNLANEIDSKSWYVTYKHIIKLCQSCNAKFDIVRFENACCIIQMNHDMLLVADSTATINGIQLSFPVLETHHMRNDNGMFTKTGLAEFKKFAVSKYFEYLCQSCNKYL